ncbi:UNVERIFIED_ORG: hypothetical protein BCL66_10989 [Martelella mediterranea]
MNLERRLTVSVRLCFFGADWQTALPILFVAKNTSFSLLEPMERCKIAFFRIPRRANSAIGIITGQAGILRLNGRGFMGIGKVFDAVVELAIVNVKTEADRPKWGRQRNGSF